MRENDACNAHGIFQSPSSSKITRYAAETSAIILATKGGRNEDLRQRNEDLRQRRTKRGHVAKTNVHCRTETTSNNTTANKRDATRVNDD